MRDEFLITRSGKQYVLYAGLLDEGHNLGLRGIETDLLQVPEKENGDVAVVKATVEMLDVDEKTGEVRRDPETGEPRTKRFSGIGDASPENVGRNIVPHIIRMAETRAKARALRDAVNVGATAFEEISDGDEAQAAPASAAPAGGGRQAEPTPIRSGRSGGKSGGQERPSGSGSAGSGGSRRGGSGGAKARKSQVDLLKTLATEWRGEEGVERLEARIGKPLGELTRTEADEWVDRLTPEDRREGGAG